ncbi:Transcriptional regulator [Rubellimicrobium mesophilum DSM 19309]|uniref:Transcriptional regulator n=1 Tax=Rubellimicrobium mesophilum DSM 19309 TaxID=442562 RepID=A0A017HHZ6_9RHOB|nr:helix-turn-helix transcriptional regulator [Rubellimicrobium mesophilum]EYD73945.1 Transcriptional regulator [Rubellimicrobium mesophilum DSM 19309]
MDRIDVLVGQRIRALRAAQGMSQAELGQKVGVRFQQIQKYESGANRVSASRLLALAQTLGVPVSHFFDGLGASGEGQAGPGATGAQTGGPLADLLVDEQFMTLARDFPRLTARQREAVLALVRSLTEGQEAAPGRLLGP